MTTCINKIYGYLMANDKKVLCCILLYEVIKINVSKSKNARFANTVIKLWLLDVVDCIHKHQHIRLKWKYTRHHEQHLMAMYVLTTFQCMILIFQFCSNVKYEFLILQVCYRNIIVTLFLHDWMIQIPNT